MVAITYKYRTQLISLLFLSNFISPVFSQSGGSIEELTVLIDKNTESEGVSVQ